MKLNENNLSDYQMGVVQDIARADFDCGHPMSDYDEVLACMEEDEDLCDVATDAADYYLEITADGAPSFYAEFDDEDVEDDYDETSSTLDDNDYNESDDPLYGYGEDDESLEESRGSKKPLKESLDIVSFDQVQEGDEGFDYGGEPGVVVMKGTVQDIIDAGFDRYGALQDGLSEGYVDSDQEAVAVDTDGETIGYTYGGDGFYVEASKGTTETSEDVKGRVYSFAFDFIVTGDDLASADEARDRILHDIELVDGIEIVGNPNVDPTSWSKAEYGLSEAATKRTSKRSLSEKRVARSENLLKTKDVKKAVLDSFKSYFDDDENFTLAKNFDPVGTLNIQINGKKKVIVAVNVSVDEKSGTYIIDGATTKDKKNLPDLYFKGSSAEEAGKDAVAAAKDVAKFAKTLEK